MSELFRTLSVQCPTGFTEILMAELSAIGFDTFLEKDDGFEASAESGSIDEQEIESILNNYKNRAKIGYKWETAQKQNWNKEWESHFDPVIVDDRCLIRADFHHISKQYPYEILINPKMSFGTGHHETTSLMISYQMNIDHKTKRVLDAGSGTGILSIMAEKMGAKDVIACDIDEWAVENSRENIIVNNCTNIHIYRGTLSDINQEILFDLVLANINKNILLEEMHLYANYLPDNGILVISGFLKEDIPDMEKAAEKFDLHLTSKKTQNNWAALVFHKKTA